MRLFEITDTPDDYLLGFRIEKIIDELCGLSMTLPPIPRQRWFRGDAPCPTSCPISARPDARP